MIYMAKILIDLFKNMHSSFDYYVPYFHISVEFEHMKHAILNPSYLFSEHSYDIKNMHSSFDYYVPYFHISVEFEHIKHAVLNLSYLLSEHSYDINF